jgi:hypothetical protein
MSWQNVPHVPEVYPEAWDVAVDRHAERGEPRPP